MRTLNRFVLLAIAPSLVACAASIDGDNRPAPVMLAVSTDQLTIGQPLDFIGGNFLNYTKDGHTEVRFKGTFTSDAGKTYAVDYRVKTLWSDGNHVTWPFVGPYANPFTGKGGDQLGTFKGQVTAINIIGTTDAEHEEVESAPVDTTLKFSPSLVIRDLQPLDATCDEPAKHALGGFGYKISVEAVGFTPRNFSYVIVDQADAPPRVFRQIAKGTTDTFGMNGELVFAPVPDAEPFYLADIGVMAVDDHGQEHRMELTLGVHRPIEYIDSGVPQIAQIEQAKPDSGCLSGGESNGSTVSYTQTTTDTRTRTLGINWDENWLKSVTDMTGGSRTQTNSVNWSATHTDMQGWEFGWMASDSVQAGGEASLFGLAKVSLQNTITGGIHKNHTWGYSDSRSVGGDHSEADTESWATTNSTSHSVSQGGSDFWAVSSSDSKSLAFTGLILPGQFGVFYRQTTRIAIPASVVAYNLCGTPQVVANADFFDYQWSLELAQGPTCSPLPVSKLPDPQCLMAPCGN
jgi:hypothetical protein